METFLDILTGFPTVIFTVMLSISLLYWLMVIMGAVDVDLLDPSGLMEGLDGAIDGAVHGAAEAAAQAATDGALDAALHGVEGVIHGAADGAAEGAAHAFDPGHAADAAGLLSVIGLRGIPCTVSLSFITLFAWVTCGMAMQFLRPFLGTGILNILAGIGIAAGAGLLGVLATTIVLRPLRGRLQGSFGRSRHSFVGLECTVMTQTVDGKFGQATIEDKGHSLLVQVRCPEENELHAGAKALIYKYDSINETYLVVPHEEV